MSTFTNLIETARSDPRKLVLVQLSAVAPSDSHNREWVKASDDPSTLIATVTLNDPATLNALTPTLMVQLNDALHALTVNPRVRACIITGAGRAFCSGGSLDLIRNGAEDVHSSIADWTTPGGGTAEPWRFIRQQFGSVVRLIANSNVFFIAALNGSAAGVGLAFALACDCIIASKEHSVMVPAFAKLGLVPEVGTSWILTRKLGYQGALRFFLWGQHVSADQALALGLVQEVCPHQALIPTAMESAQRILAMPAHAVEMTKTLLRASTDCNFDTSLRMEEFAEANCFSTRALPLAAKAILKAKV